MLDRCGGCGTEYEDWQSFCCECGSSIVKDRAIEWSPADPFADDGIIISQPKWDSLNINSDLFIPPKSDYFMALDLAHNPGKGNIDNIIISANTTDLDREIEQNVEKGSEIYRSLVRAMKYE